MTAMPRKPFDYIPVAVGAGAGLVGGVVGLPSSSSNPVIKYREGIYKSALVGGGLAGHFLGWDDDLTYGLLCSGAFAFAQQIAPAIHGKSVKTLFTATAPAHGARVAPSRGHAAGCSSCGTAAAALRNPEAVRVGAPARPAAARALLGNEAPGLL